MNTSGHKLSRSLIAAAITAALAAGCASTPKKPAGSEQVRAKLTALQNDAALAAQAPVATKDAEAAVKRAEKLRDTTDRLLRKLHDARRTNPRFDRRRSR